MASVRVRGQLQKLLPWTCSFVNTSLCVRLTTCFIVSHRGWGVIGEVIRVLCFLYQFVLLCNICCATTYYNTWGKSPLCSVQQSGVRGFFVAHTASSCPTFVWLERIIL